MNSVNEKKEMSQYKKAIVKLNEIAQIKRNVSQPESMKTSVEPPTPTSAKESFKPEHTNTTRKKCRFENQGKCKNGRSCQFYHPRRTCKFFSQSNTCQKGEKM